MAVRGLRSIYRVSTHAPTRGATPRASRRRSCGNRFNPRAHTRRDPMRLFSASMCAAFQPTRPHEARRSMTTTPSWTRRFNPRAHTRRDSAAADTPAAYGIVSTHAPTRGATAHAHQPRLDDAPFQPTRPHEARPAATAGHRVVLEVSTHAPTRGATGLVRVVGPGEAVSTHAPTRGATSAVRRGVQAVGSFNPRAHTRRDMRSSRSHTARAVSTHAPTRGAT